MIPAGDLERRLENNIQTMIEGVNLYELLRAPMDAIVREKNVEGEATVALTLPDGCLCIQWNLPTGLFRVLKEEANADGAFILQRPDGNFEAHVVECKTTVDRSTWRKARLQMRWTLSRLRALAGVLGVELRRGVLYTAFRMDKLSPDSDRNLHVQKRRFKRGGKGDAEIDWNLRMEREWDDDAVVFEAFDGSFVHRKIQLDDSGEGSASFA